MTLRFMSEISKQQCSLVEIEAKLDKSSQTANMETLSIAFVARLHLSQLSSLSHQANYT